MPNWCENKMIARGSNTDLVAFLRHHVVNGEFDFNTVIPEPKLKKDCPKAYIIKDAIDARELALSYEGKRKWFNWFNWHCNFWGAKWNADNYQGPDENEIVQNNYDEIVIWFDTAWSPAIPIAKKLIEMYPELEIEMSYFEGGMWFGGKVTKDGNFEIECDKLKDFAIEEGFDAIDIEREE